MFGLSSQARNFAACLRDLESASAVVRAGAARDLGRHTRGEARKEAISALEKALDDAASEVRGAAAMALADAEATEAIPALLAMSKQPAPFARQMAISALGELGAGAKDTLDEATAARVRERLRRAFEDEAAEVRFQAVIAYPRVAADADAGAVAIEAATRDADPLVVQAALRAAEEHGETVGAIDARLLRRARALLGHDAPLVRIAAAVCLARGGEVGGEDILAAVVKGELATREGADEAAAIELAGELKIEAARAALRKRAFSGAFGLFRDRFQWHARVALARMGDARARGEILRELRSWDPNRRTLAVAAAGRAKMTDTKELLVSMQRDGRADANALDEALRSLAETS